MRPANGVWHTGQRTSVYLGDTLQAAVKASGMPRLFAVALNVHDGGIQAATPGREVSAAVAAWLSRMPWSSHAVRRSSWRPYTAVDEPHWRQAGDEQAYSFDSGPARPRTGYRQPAAIACTCRCI